MTGKLRVALVHDWLNQLGGAESVLEELHSLYPEAPIYTSMYWPEAMPPHYRQWDIRTTWLNRIQLSKTHHQWFLLAYPFAFGSLDLSAYDLVISNKSAFCFNVRTGAQNAPPVLLPDADAFRLELRNLCARRGRGRHRAARRAALSALFAKG